MQPVELDGHPTWDMIEELERRGAARLDGTNAGPSIHALRFLAERAGESEGLWLFLPAETFNTGMDDAPL